jgi:RNA polymerase sigma-70 factor (ECF subfamily)
VGDTAADADFESTALACLPHVERFARSLAQQSSDAEDLVQETYLRAFRSRHTFKADGNMRRWLFTICKHVFLRTRERDRRDIVSLDEDPTDATLGVARLHNVLVASGETSLLDQVDVGPAILRALHALTPPARMVVVLVDFEGYGYAEAADVLGVPVGTVRSRLFRARRTLQESLVAYARDAGVLSSVNERGL